MRALPHESGEVGQRRDIGVTSATVKVEASNDMVVATWKSQLLDRAVQH